MGKFTLRLRTKSILALVVAFILALAPTLLIGWEMLERGRAHFGEAYAKNFTLLNAQRIKAPVTRDLALAKRFADSVLLRQWLSDEASAEKKKLFFREAGGFEAVFRDRNYFLVSRQSRNYYLNNPEKPYSQSPRYTLDPENPDDGWFFNTMAECDTFNINVNPDVHLGETRVWINVVVWDEGEKLGLAGTGFNLGGFLDQFITVEEPGVTPMIIDGQGMIQAHPNRDLIAFGSGAGASKEAISLKDRLADPADAGQLAEAMKRVRQSPGAVEILWAQLNGKTQLMALTWIPELDWHVVSAVDLKAAKVLEETWLMAIIGGMVVMFAVLLLVFGYGMDKLILTPLNRLHKSATALSGGNYDVTLPPARRDEIGDLSRAFSKMVAQIKSHTRELEEKVRERTRTLEAQSKLLAEAKETAEQASREKTEMLNKVMESIHYAQTIQQAILTTQAQLKDLVSDGFIFWQPKDVISGDMVWSKAHEDGFALAVIDCTGHGVPGGVMTMAAVSSLDRVVSEIGLHDPRRVLQGVSRVVQQMLSSQEAAGFSEDGLDMALCVYTRTDATLRFAGSRLSLFYDCGERVVEIKGDRQSLGYRSSNPDYPFTTHEIRMEGPCRFYMITDGLVDQVGEAAGLPLGKQRFLEFLNTIPDQPMADQRAALQKMFAEFQGHEEQRDDVTAMGFRLNP